MDISGFPFGAIDWKDVEAVEHTASAEGGGTGSAIWRTLEVGGVRVRMVEYSPGYVSDHWCQKGHIVLCIAGELQTELKDGRRFTLRPGMSFHVADGGEAHRSSTEVGARLFIVD
ncbi:MAG: DHCW motif cupin fold protein [Phycisphaerales bacterium]|nr:DHCW motif cupin fold protein [Phycisphaerales bacterium]